MNLSASAPIKLLRFLRMPRFWLAGPVTLLLSIFAMAAMSLWVPPGKANVNHIAYPIILFPLIWAVAFFYAVLEANIKRATMVLLLLLFVNGGLVIASVMGYLS